MKIINFLIFFSLAICINGFANDDGKTLFRNKCKACHSIDQRLVGPALKDISERRDSVWLFNFINGSQAMIESGDTLAMSLFLEYNQIPMPNQNISKSEFDLIMDYIKAESAPKPIAENPIKRPPKQAVKANVQLQFSNYFFWIPFTLFVILFIIVLRYMTVVADMAKED